MKTVISAQSAVFPGASNVEAYWQRIVAAQPAEAVSFQKIWQQDLAAQARLEKIYMDKGFALPEPFEAVDAPYSLPDEGRQLKIGTKVLGDLLAEAQAAGRKPLDMSRCALILGTSWSDAHYMAADSRMLVFDQDPKTAMRGLSLDPGSQLSGLADAISCLGPRFAVDTACASSLYALACGERLLESQEVDHVLVLGLNAYLPPFLFMGFCKIQALSKQGLILPFSEKADGIVLGEGVAALLLERADTALKAGRRPLALVRSIGLSADGREGSIFTPGRQGQWLAYQRAYRDIELDSIDYIEAHGTGTPLGDAAEIEGLGALFASSQRESIPLGSVKGLIGHTLAAAGLASIVKANCILQQRFLPAHRVAEPSMRLQGSKLKLLAEGRAVGDLQRPLRVAINALGFGGANAHVILEEWRDDKQAAVPGLARKAPRLALTAADMRFGSLAQPGLMDLEGLAKSSPAPFPARAGQRSSLYPLGGYFSGNPSVDRRYLNLGPAQIKRLDPFLALLTHQLSGVHAQSKQSLSIDEIAVFACSNFGSESTLRMTRKFQAAVYERPWSEDMSLNTETITSCLPSLTSGWPASAANLRAQHMTLSGGRDNFWTALSQLPYWFSDHLKKILLGVSSFVKSPYDLSSTGGRMPLEVSAAMAFMPADADHEDALLYMEVHYEKNGDADRTIDCLGQDESFPWSLAEATGLEEFSDFLLGKAVSRTIDVYRGARFLARFVLTRGPRAYLMPQDTPAEFAVSLNFGEPVRSSVSSSAPHKEQPDGGFGEELHSLMQAWLLSRHRVQTALAHGMVLDFFDGKRSERNTVLHSLRASADGCEAELVVDESHPYFFDHPLDHVPGILILEGAGQLAEHYGKMRGIQGRFLAQADINFRRYVEKTEGAQLVLKEGQAGKFRVDIQQSGKICCFVLFELKASGKNAFKPAPKSDLILPGRGVLHKHRQENVLTSCIERIPYTGEEMYRAFALKIPEGHFFQDGHADYHSLVYLLEIARQCMMQLAHNVMQIPRSVPMNLVRLQLRLETPVPRIEGLELRCRKSRVIESDGQLLARIVTSFHLGGQSLGEVEIGAQVMDPAYYQQQRGQK